LSEKFSEIFYPFFDKVQEKEIFLRSEKKHDYFNHLLDLAMKQYKHFEIIPQEGCSISSYSIEIRSIIEKLKKDLYLNISKSDCRNMNHQKFWIKE
jgi:hypothetical protein